MTIDLTTKIVAAYLGNNVVAASDIPDLIRKTYSALVGTASPAALPVEARQPAVPVKKSVTPDAIICLDCGVPHKMLKRHLHTAHDLTVDEYRAKWSLAADYPVVAPDYAARRSALAVSIGLGRKRAVEVATAAIESSPATETTGHSYPASRWSKPSA